MNWVGIGSNSAMPLGEGTVSPFSWGSNTRQTTLRSMSKRISSQLTLHLSAWKLVHDSHNDTDGSHMDCPHSTLLLRSLTICGYRSSWKRISHGVSNKGRCHWCHESWVKHLKNATWLWNGFGFGIAGNAIFAKGQRPALHGEFRPLVLQQACLSKSCLQTGVHCKIVQNGRTNWILWKSIFDTSIQILSLKLAHRQLDCRRSSLPKQAASLEGWICNLSTFSEMGRLCRDLLRCEVKHEIKIDHMNLRQLSQTAHRLVRPEVAWNHLVKTDCEDLRGLKMEAMERKPSWNLHQLTSGYYVALRCTMPFTFSRNLTNHRSNAAFMA